MAIKNVGGPLSNGAIAKAKDSDASKGVLVPEIGNSNSISQASTNIGSANQNYGVELSDRGRTRSAEQKRSFDIAKNTPDVREDRVADIKARMKAGTYEVDSGKIADGMVREAIMEHLATDKDR
jgi:negative regulator of flagellin synthesis FlgM